MIRITATFIGLILFTSTALAGTLEDKTIAYLNSEVQAKELISAVLKSDGDIETQVELVLTTALNYEMDRGAKAILMTDLMNELKRLVELENDLPRQRTIGLITMFAGVGSLVGILTGAVDAAQYGHDLSIQLIDGVFYGGSLGVAAGAAIDVVIRLFDRSRTVTIETVNRLHSQCRTALMKGSKQKN